MFESLSWIRFNISAATPESYKLIHNVESDIFEKVKENIRLCVEFKKRHNLKITIGLQMVVIDENINDIIPLAKLGKKLGVDYFVIKSCSDTPDKRLKAPTGKYLKIKEIFQEAEKYSDENYKVIVKWSKIQNLGKKDYKTCYGTQFILGISGSGNVFPCGHFFNIRQDEFLMGNIIKTSFKEIIKSERYWEVQKRIQKVDVNNECESNCRQHYINEFLYKLKNPPKHINFI